MQPTLAWQASIFGVGEPAVDPSFAGAVRHRLDDECWVDHVRGWVSGSDELFQRIVETSAWQQRTVEMYGKLVAEPRLTVGWHVDDERVLPAVRDMAASLTARYGLSFEHVWVNLYRDGTDSVAWHGDRNRKHEINPLVAIVSLGEPRKFQLRPRGTTAVARTFWLGGGDLLVMGGACQHFWEHAVPKVAKAGPRMSVTLRHTYVGSSDTAPRSRLG